MCVRMYVHVCVHVCVLCVCYRNLPWKEIVANCLYLPTDMTFTVSELNGRAFFNTSSKSTTTTVVVPAISLGITCANVTFYSTVS